MRQKTVLFLSATFLLSFLACKPEDNKIEEIEKTAQTSEEYSEYIMFNDDETGVEYLNGARSFDPREPVQVSINADQQLFIRNYSPRQIKDVNIWVKHVGYNEEFLLQHFDTLKPFLEFKMKLPFVKGNKDYKTRSGKEICVVKNPETAAADFETISTESSDPLFAKFKEIKTTWRVQFSDFQYPQHDYWRHITPVICREVCALSINSAYMFSHKKYEKLLEDNEGIFRNNIPDGPARNNFEEFLKAGVVVDNKALLQKSLDRNARTLNWGTLGGVGGLGGSSVLGMLPGCYVQHYGDDDGGGAVMFHEYGHGMGFGDSTNSVISFDGFVNGQEKDGKKYYTWRYLVQELYVEMCITKELPVYSKRFLSSRKVWPGADDSFRLHPGNRGIVIEDPELDALDGGVSGVRATMSDPNINKGGAIPACTIDYKTAGFSNFTEFIPKALAVYGNKLYVVNAADKNACHLISINLGATPSLDKKVQDFSYQMVVQAGDDGESFNIETKEVKLNNVRDVYRSHDKIYVNYNSPGAIAVFSAKDMKCLQNITNTVSTTVLARQGMIYVGYRDFILFSESSMENEASALARVGGLMNANDNNRFLLDLQENLWGLEYGARKIIKFNTTHVLQSQMPREKEFSTNAVKCNVEGFDAKNWAPLSLSFINSTQALATLAQDGNEGKCKLCLVNFATGELVIERIFDAYLNPKFVTVSRETAFIIDVMPSGKEAEIQIIPLKDLLK